MESLPDLTHTGWPFPFTPEDWEHTPSAVQAYLRTMRDALGATPGPCRTNTAKHPSHQCGNNRLYPVYMTLISNQAARGNMGPPTSESQVLISKELHQTMQSLISLGYSNLLWVVSSTNSPHANSTTSHRPPSSDSPYKKPRQRPTTTPRKAGGKPGHPGHRQALLPPTTVHEVRPERCPVGTRRSL